MARMSQSKIDTMIWLGMGAAAIAAWYYAQSQGILPATGTTGPAASPLAIYPEYAYTAQPVTTSMASSPAQKATASIMPTPLFQAVQAQEQAAVLGQCAGSYPGCTVLTGDTQLGF